MHSQIPVKRFTLALAATLTASTPALAAPSIVTHTPGSQVFGEPAGITQREPLTPREGETVQVWAFVGPSFSYDRVAIYYTTDGTTPTGSKGVPSGTTAVLLSSLGEVNFVRNEGSNDWWVGTMPAATRTYPGTVQYTIGAWDSGSADPEKFSDGGGIYPWSNLLAWPGAGSGAPNPGAGYPPLHFWKEEAVAGNNYINVMLDQNGSIYDVYYPSAGAVQGIGTKNEGYNGPEEHPAGLTSTQRGQMHMNQAFLGIRPTNPADGSGTTYWLTNAQGTDFADVTQVWASDDSNVIRTSQRLVAGGHNISIVQHDFAPKGIVFPSDQGANPNRGISLKRTVLTNNGASPVELNVYAFADWALNGGDQFDGTFTDQSRGAMIAYDNTFRFANAVGEYNPTTFGDYEKDVSVYLATAMRTSDVPGSPSGVAATDFWSDTSPDQGIGWLGSKITLAPGESKEVGVMIVGGFDAFAGATDTYNFQQAPAIDWFLAADLDDLQDTTHTYWQDWLASGVSFESPDADYQRLYQRGLLGTALHLDGENGGIIAGMHNGAYPFVWPRDAAWAAITLARTGFVTEAKEIVRFLRDITYRDVEGWGRKGFWKQKYTTDGYTIWSNPQVDETSCFPWATRYIYDIEGDTAFLDLNYDEVYEAGLASSQDSTVDGQLRYEESVDLVFSMNLWEDTFDVTNYANASVIRGLEDAAAIADILDQTVCPGGPGTCGYHTDKALFLARAAAIRGGLDARLAWNGENTDISQLGITYPFGIYPPGHPRVELVMDRINGVALDTFGNNHPLVNFSGEFTDLINRYWGDGYWAGGPWFLSTLWYGAYYAQRQDITAGTDDIDNHKFRIDLLMDRTGPMGFGAEQIAPVSGLLYAGQTDYQLQTAYPNAWESMSFFADAVMLFLDYRPDAASNTLRVRPKLPSDWQYMEYGNIALGAGRYDLRVETATEKHTHRFTNRLGGTAAFDTVVRIPAGQSPCAVFVNGSTAPHTVNTSIGAVAISGALSPGVGADTIIQVWLFHPADLNNSGAVNAADFTILAGNFGASGATRAQGDINGDGLVNAADFTILAGVFGLACP
jgi:GH15 family glucan-1,4-alpha-glucosidase